MKELIRASFCLGYFIKYTNLKENSSSGDKSRVNYRII